MDVEWDVNKRAKFSYAKVGRKLRMVLGRELICLISVIMVLFASLCNLDKKTSKLKKQVMKE